MSGLQAVNIRMNKNSPHMQQASRQNKGLAGDGDPFVSLVVFHLPNGPPATFLKGFQCVPGACYLEEFEGSRAPGAHEETSKRTVLKTQ